MTERTSVGLQRNIIANKRNKIEIANNNFYNEKHGNVAIIGQLNYFYSFNFYEKLQRLTSSKKIIVKVEKFV